MFTFLLPPSSDYVIIHLGGYNCSLPMQSAVCDKLHDNCTLPIKPWWSELGVNKDVNKLAKSAYCYFVELKLSTPIPPLTVNMSKFSSIRIFSPF